MSATTFIYALCEPDTRTVRYIGKADNPEKRGYCHVKEAYNSKSKTHRYDWLRSLQAREAKPNLVILKEVPVSEWQEWERRYIYAAKALGFSLVNGTDGGEGLQNPSKDTREKIRVGNVGKKHSLESRAKISAAKKGKKLTPEHVENSARARRGKKFTVEQCERLSLAHLGQVCSAETRVKMSVSQRARRTKEKQNEQIKKLDGKRNSTTPRRKGKRGIRESDSEKSGQDGQGSSDQGG